MDTSEYPAVTVTIEVCVPESGNIRVLIANRNAIREGLARRAPEDYFALDIGLLRTFERKDHNRHIFSQVTTRVVLYRTVLSPI